MKKYLPALLAASLPFIAVAQDPAFLKEQSALVASERKAAEGLMTSGMQSVASGNYDVKHYRCEWIVDPAVRYIQGKITTTFSMIQPGNSITFDMVNQLVADSVVYHGSKINFTRLPNNGLEVQFPSNLNAGTRDSVSIYYQGNPAGGGFGAFYQGLHAGVPVMWTLSEPYGAKDWWPCKDGLTDKADSVDILLTHPGIYNASSNGMMVSRQAVSGGNVVTHFRHRYRIATYLVAIAITNYVVNSDTVRVGNKSYPLISYAYPENAASFFGSETYAKEAFRIFTQLFGEYPFANEKYGHTQFGWSGGMEHQTNSFMLNTSPTLSAHELAHQWFGDKITCGSWQHIWLNEGFATYLTALFLQYGFPSFYRQYLENTLLASVVSQPGGSVFVPDTTSSNRIFDSRLTYNKGAYVVHMLRWVLGDSAFFRGMRQYLEDPALRYNFAKTADLQRNLEQVSGKNLNTFFQKWVYGEGYANYQATWYQGAGSPWVSLRLNQTTSHNSVAFYEMPVEIEFRNATQSVRRVVDHRYSGQVFSLNVGFKADTVIIDPDIWILAKTKTVSRTTTELLPPDDLQLYPNPSPGDAVLRLRNATGNKLSVRLFNAVGQLLFSRDIATAPGALVEVNIPLTRYPKGTYVVDIRNDRSLKVRKKIVH